MAKEINSIERFFVGMKGKDFKPYFNRTANNNPRNVRLANISSYINNVPESILHLATTYDGHVWGFSEFEIALALRLRLSKEYGIPIEKMQIYKEIKALIDTEI